MTTIPAPGADLATDELLPCPFCGSSALVDEHPPHSHAGGIAGFMPDYPGSFTLECMGKGCNTGLIADTREEVVAMWNRRASLAAVPASEPPQRDTDATLTHEGTKVATPVSVVPDLTKIADTLQNCASMLDTIKMEWTADGSWSEYDQGVRNAVSSCMASLSGAVWPLANPDRLKTSAPAPQHTTNPTGETK